MCSSLPTLAERKSATIGAKELFLSWGKRSHLFSLSRFPIKNNFPIYWISLFLHTSFDTYVHLINTACKLASSFVQFVSFKRFLIIAYFRFFSSSNWKLSFFNIKKETRLGLWLPGNVLLLRNVSPTTIGAKELNFCVRHGNRCDLLAIVTRQWNVWNYTFKTR